MSSVGYALVVMVDAQPCFSVPVARATGPPALRLSSLTVSQTERTDWRVQPPEMWGFTVDPPGLTMDNVGSRACIRYGLPFEGGTSHGPARAPEAARLYGVEISARPLNGDSGTIVYAALFCVRPQAGGAKELHAVVWDKRERRHDYGFCAHD